MGRVWKKAMAILVAIAIGMVVGAGCGSEEKKGNKRKARAATPRGLKAEGGAGAVERKLGAIWLEKPLAEIELTPRQKRKIEKINVERAKSRKGRKELRDQLEQVGEGENAEAVAGLREVLDGAKDANWLPRVRAVLDEAQQEKFDANTQGRHRDAG